MSALALLFCVNVHRFGQSLTYFAWMEIWLASSGGGVLGYMFGS